MIEEPTPADTDTDTPQTNALRLAAIGLRVLPIRPGGKSPPMKSWQHAATNNPSKVTAWYKGLYRDAGVGLALGDQPNGNHIFALDLDNHGDGDGADELADLEHHHGNLPDTWRSVTGSDGAHLIFTTPPGITVRNQQASGNRVSPNIDVRGQGGQIVVAPTIHPDTLNAYAWEHGYAPWEHTIAEAPPWLIKLVAEPPPTPPPPKGPSNYDGPSVADQLRANWDWTAELTARGWTADRTTPNGDTYWTRPGKPPRSGHSAVLHPGGPFVVFTTSLPDSWPHVGHRTVDGSGYSLTPFDFVAANDHDGDRSQAARTLGDTNTPPAADHPNPHKPEDYHPIELIDWATIHDHGDEITPGLLMPGRWTALAAGAKAGKTTLEMFVTIEISQGRDPFDGNEIEPVTVLYIDAEMGRLDLEERIHELGHPDPLKLTNWYASDLPPRLDTIPGGNALQLAVEKLGAKVVVIDGINGTVDGAEKDDMTWRAFYDHAIFPLKRKGVAVITGDNHGKDATLGPRGSSVKLDKPDAVINLKRTDNGVKLTTTHRRTSAYPPELLLSIGGLDGNEPITYRRTNTKWAVGTEDLAALLDEIGVPIDWGRGKAKQALNDAGGKAGTELLASVLRYRRLHPRVVSLDLKAKGQVKGQVKNTSRTGPEDRSQNSPSTREDRSKGQVRTGPTVKRTGGGCVEKDTPNVQTASGDDLTDDEYTIDDLF